MATPSALGRVAANNVIVKQAGIASLAAKAFRSGGRAMGGAARLGGRAALGATKVPLKGYGKLWSKAGPAGKLGLTAGTAIAGYGIQDATRAGLTSAGELQDTIKHQTQYDALHALAGKDLLSKQRGGSNPLLEAGTSPGLLQMLASPFRTYKAYSTPDEAYAPKGKSQPVPASELGSLPQHNPRTGAPRTYTSSVREPTETYQSKAKQELLARLAEQKSQREDANAREIGGAKAQATSARGAILDSRQSQGYDMPTVEKNLQDPFATPAAEAGTAAAGATGPGTPTAQILAANDPLPVMKVKLEARQAELLGIIAAVGASIAGAPSPAASEATQELEQLRNYQLALGRIGEEEKKKDKAVDSRTTQELNWDYGQ